MSGFGEERVAPANGIELAYQEMGDPAGPPLLLIMGLGTQMFGWDEAFCELLAQRGFRVIRFDNRDVGHSTSIDSAGMPKRVDMLLGLRRSAPYLLTDMADDTTGLMDHLGIESGAHIVGASMGGMIGQTLAIHHPERVLSLVSMMSTTGNRFLGMPTRRASSMLLAPYPRSREAYVEQAVKMFSVIGSPGFPLEEERIRRVAEVFYDRGRNPAGVARQMHAITASGDRTRALHGLRVPTTVIHGAEDPLMRPAAGRATARAIPGARLRMIEGMGHDLPRALWPVFADEIAANAERSARIVADGAATGRAAVRDRA